ncbi:MAG: hypothetical protein J2P21_21730 [Chloracidobacterium sp.]|nr:hypothetical protein [Chloracidobacterium sp.]
MSDKQLDLLKEQLAPLSPQEKLEPARFLTEQARLDQAAEQSVAVMDRADADVKRALQADDQFAHECQVRLVACMSVQPTQLSGRLRP